MLRNLKPVNHLLFLVGNKKLMAGQFTWFETKMLEGDINDASEKLKLFSLLVKPQTTALDHIDPVQTLFLPGLFTPISYFRSNLNGLSGPSPSFFKIDVMHRSIRKFNIPPGQESRSNAPPISTELPLRKDKFRLQSNTLHAFQREICRNDTFKLYSLTKAKFYLVNPLNHAKNKKLTGVLHQNKR